MKRKLILFTHKFPQGKSEQTFIKFEISKLVKYYDDIEIIPEKISGETLNLDKKIKVNVNLTLAKKLNFLNFLLYFISSTIFSSDYYKEINKVLFKKHFIFKFKVLTIELTKSFIAYKWILKENKIKENKIVLYSFWSNFLLLTFERFKKKNHSIITISRTLGSDLNGFLKNDNYVPYIEKKFYSLNHLFVLEKNQKKILLKGKLIKKSKISILPLGVYKQKKISHKLNNSNINFLSCHNLIKIKNTSLILKFLKQFSKQMRKKEIIFYLIGEGKEGENISQKAFKLKKHFITKRIKRVNNLLSFLKNKKINYFINLSSQEGMSFSIMEAMSCGVPVITSNILANKFLVNHTRGYNINIERFDSSSKEIVKKIIYDFNNKKSYYKKSYNSKVFIDNNLLNYKCNKKFITKLKTLNFIN